MLTPVIPALGMFRQEDCLEFVVVLGYRVQSCLKIKTRMRQKMDSFYRILNEIFAVAAAVVFKAAFEPEPEAGFTKPSPAAPVHRVLPSCSSRSPCLINARGALIMSELKWECVPKCDSLQHYRHKTERFSNFPRSHSQ